MLSAHGSLQRGASSFESRVFFERGFRAFSVERRGLMWDSAFAPARESSGAGITSIYVVLAGEVTFSTRVVCKQNSLFFATESQLDGENGARAVTLFADGEPFRSLELRIDPAHCIDSQPDSPSAILATPDILQTAQRVIDEHDQDAMRAFLDALAAAKILRANARDLVTLEEPEEITRVWNAVAKYYLKIDTAPPLQALADAAGISLRQMSRDIETILMTFPIGGDGYREYVTDVRLRWAVTLLSALPIEEVAHAVGYGSMQALGRAFRDAKLPTPGAIKRGFASRK